MICVYRVADCIQAACRMLAEVTSSIPDFTCVSAAKLMKLIETQEANHIEFARMRNIAEDVLLMANDPQLSKVLDLLLDPTWLATGTISCFFHIRLVLHCCCHFLGVGIGVHGC